MVSKVWSMALVVLVVAPCSLLLVVQGDSRPDSGVDRALRRWNDAFRVPDDFARRSARDVRALDAAVRSTDDLVIMPLLILSGAFTPHESMPEFVQTIMLGAPNTNFEMFTRRCCSAARVSGGGAQLAALTVIGAVMLFVSLARFRRTLGSMA